MVVLVIENNNTGKIEGDKKELLKLFKAFAIRHPDQFFLRKAMPKGWDGKINYIKESGKFQVGLLEQIGEKCDSLGIEWDVADFREDIPKAKKVTKHGDWKLRDYQIDAVKSIVTNKVKDVRWPRGTIRVATNGGKTSISSFIYLNYKLPTVFLMNSAELFEQALKELPVILQEPVGQISAKKIEWANFMVCMVATTRNRLKKDKDVFNKLSKYPCLIVDEGDLTDNKTNKEVIRALYNTQIRVALSGTINMDIRSKKHEIKNLNISGFFGKLLYDISNKDLIEKGVSSNVHVHMVLGNEEGFEGYKYDDMYEEGIVNNHTRNKKVVRRSQLHWSEGRTNQLVIAQRHNHIKNLYKLYQSAQKAGVFPEETNIDWVHHSRADRMEVVEAFQRGEVDILIGSMILKRGKNFPKMSFMINVGGGKSPENTLQLLGRAFRGAQHYEDFWDKGKYLESHSRKRSLWYKREGIKVTIDKG